MDSNFLFRAEIYRKAPSIAAGATWADVVKTNTFVTDFEKFQKCADIRMRYLGVATPTSTTVGVTRFAGPDFMIEIEAVAVVIPKRRVRADSVAAARQPRSEEGEGHGSAITRATPVTPELPKEAGHPPLLHAECGADFNFDRLFT